MPPPCPVPPELEAEQNHRMLPAPERQPEPRGALGPPQKWPLDLRAESAQAGRSWAAAGVPGWSCTWCRCRCWLRKVPLEATQVLSRGAASMYCCVMMQAGVQPPGAGVCGGLWRTARPAGLCPQVQPSSSSGAFPGVASKSPVSNPSWPPCPLRQALPGPLPGGPGSQRPRGEARCYSYASPSGCGAGPQGEHLQCCTPALSSCGQGRAPGWPWPCHLLACGLQESWPGRGRRTGRVLPHCPAPGTRGADPPSVGLGFLTWGHRLLGLTVPQTL